MKWQCQWSRASKALLARRESAGANVGVCFAARTLHDATQGQVAPSQVMGKAGSRCAPPGPGRTCGGDSPPPRLQETRSGAPGRRLPLLLGRARGGEPRDESCPREVSRKPALGFRRGRVPGIRAARGEPRRDICPSQPRLKRFRYKAPGHPEGLMLPQGMPWARRRHGASGVGPPIPSFLVAFGVSHTLLTSKVFKHCDRVAVPHQSPALRARRS